MSGMVDFLFETEFMPSYETVRLIISVWPHMTSDAKSLVRRELGDAIRRDAIDRDIGKDIAFLGVLCDRDSWEELDEFIDRQDDE